MKALWHEQRTWSLAQASQEVPRAYDAWKAPLFRSSYGSVDLWWFIEQFLVILETWVSWGSRRSTNTFDKGKGLILLFLPMGGHRILPQGVKETSSQPLSVSKFLPAFLHDGLQYRSGGALGHVTPTTSRSWLSLQFSQSESTHFILNCNRKLRHAKTM